MDKLDFPRKFDERKERVENMLNLLLGLVVIMNVRQLLSTASQTIISKVGPSWKKDLQYNSLPSFALLLFTGARLKSHLV